MENIVFRKSFNGYNKDDVNSYVISISRKVSEAEIAKQEALAKLDAAEKEKELLSAELAVLKLKAENLAKTGAGISNTELENLKKTLEEVTRERDEYKNAVEANEEKSRQYDSLSSKLGEVMITANAQAQALISDAEKRANARYDEMLDDSRAKVGELNEKYSGKIFDKTRELLKRLDDIVTDSALLKAEVKVALDEDIEECKNHDGGDKIEQ